MSEGRKVFGARKLRLLHELAAGVKTQTELAEQYGITQGRISQILSESAEQIEAIRSRADDEFSGLWLADRRNRIAEYQGHVERINDKLDAKPDAVDHNLIRASQIALKGIAEETGQLTTKTFNEVAYRVHGVDTEALQ